MSRYVDAFSFDKPKESFDLLVKRLKRGQLLDDEVANYFKERAAIEEKYANDLTKLAKKHTLSSGERDFIGNFSGVWDQMLGATNEVAGLHMMYAKELSEKLEKPLRGRIHADADWSKLRQYETEFGRTTKDYDDKVIKHLKATAKASKKGTSDKLDKKVADALAARDTAKNQWVPQAMEMFERFQLMDESRLAFLKEVISKCADLDAKQGSAQNAISDALLAAVMSFDVTHDTAVFCSAKGNKSGPESGISQYVVNDVSSSTATSRKNSVVLPSDGGLGIAGATTNHGQQNQPTVDAEGYSVPPPHASAPWDAAPRANLEEEEVDAGSSTGRIKVAIQKEAIVENPDDVSRALKHLQNVLPSSTSRATKRTSRRLSFSDAAKARSPDINNLSRKRMTIHMDNANAAQLGTSIDAFGSPPPSSMMPSLEPAKAPSYSSVSIPSNGASIVNATIPVKAALNETVNVLLQENTIDKVLLTGDISILCATDASTFMDNMTFILRIQNYERLAQVVPNDAFARVADPLRPNEFEISLGALRQTGVSLLPVIKYQVLIEDADAFTPLFVHPLWKCEPKQTSLLLAYQMNPTLQPPISLSDVSFLVPIEGGGNISGVQMKPNGIWNPERRAILWKAGELSAPSDGQVEQPGKLLARLETTEACTPSTVAIRFTSQGALLSGIDLSVATPSGSQISVQLENVEKSFSAGKYAGR